MPDTDCQPLSLDPARIADEHHHAGKVVTARLAVLGTDYDVPGDAIEAEHVERFTVGAWSRTARSAAADRIPAVLGYAGPTVGAVTGLTVSDGAVLIAIELSEDVPAIAAVAYRYRPVRRSPEGVVAEARLLSAHLLDHVPARRCVTAAAFVAAVEARGTAAALIACLRGEDVPMPGSDAADLDAARHRARHAMTMTATIEER